MGVGKTSVAPAAAAFDREALYALLRTIPRGRVVTYGQLAALLGNRAWARAVGNALHANPDGNANPCYRVVNARGELSRAYAFGGPAEQARRLEADGIPVQDGRVDLKIYGL
jgi:O-6-methylguanine DNA methyltransferase